MPLETTGIGVFKAAILCMVHMMDSFGAVLVSTWKMVTV